LQGRQTDLPAQAAGSGGPEAVEQAEQRPWLRPAREDVGVEGTAVIAELKRPAAPAGDRAALHLGWLPPRREMSGPPRQLCSHGVEPLLDHQHLAAPNQREALHRVAAGRESVIRDAPSMRDGDEKPVPDIGSPACRGRGADTDERTTEGGKRESQTPAAHTVDTTVPVAEVPSPRHVPRSHNRTGGVRTP
jgi:hypothetical protein